jgi:hypothetical protein
MKYWAKGLFAGLLMAVRLAAQGGSISQMESLSAPTPHRLETVYAAAQRDGWLPQSSALKAAAFYAYEHDKLAAAEQWFNAYRWTILLGQSEGEFVSKWVAAVQAARVAHANMPTSYEPRQRPLAAVLSPQLQSWLLGNAAFSSQFFSLLSPVDNVPRVFEILGQLHQADPGRFKTYANLALAIAVVYDVPPPPHWPHAQVTPAALPRRLAAPLAAFTWWIGQERKGATFHQLTRLGADELKFVVDTAAPFPELEWTHSAVDLPLPQLAKSYAMVRYRTERLALNTAVWPGSTYKLPQILGTGGICTDQAYFATQVGKARGVPTLLICGAGNDARHAWFGFLDEGGKWQLDAGRYAEQRFVTGFALDPQTWAQFSDHELQFLSDRFRALPAFKQSQVHAVVAAEYLALDKAPAAAVAARKAVNFERRNQGGWETLFAAARKEGRDVKIVENLMREAALAFQRYPDLEAHYVNRVAESLRARGQTSAAEEEVRRIARQNKGKRGDLSVKQARDIVRRAIATQPLAEQIKAYNSAVDTYGHSAGVGFFDEIVAPFAVHLVQLNRRPEALNAIERSRRVLNVEPNSQLAGEIESLTRLVKIAN